MDELTASAEVDLRAVAANVAALRAHAGRAELMVVVKADGYGHGMLACAAAARAAGAEWLGVAFCDEALALRKAGDTGPVLAWLYGPDTDLTAPVAAGVDLSAQSELQLTALTAAAATAGRPARVHLKVDTGLSRNGARPETWSAVCRAAAEAEQIGGVEVVAVWSHLACADEPGHPSVATQRAVFEQALQTAADAGLRPRLRHLANSAATLVVPEAHYDLVRVGIAAYGVEPAPGLAARSGVPLVPVMTLRAQLVNVKRLRPGDGVSYGHTWVAARDTVVGLVPLGYADGVPRHAGNRAEVQVGGRRAPVAGRICMDQFVVDLGPDSEAEVGDEVVLFGRGTDGAPTAADWAVACDTIGYEIVTRIGARVPRVFQQLPASSTSLHR